MTYSVGWYGNKLIQFGKLQVDVVLTDSEGVRPNYRFTLDLPSNYNDADIIMKGNERIPKAEAAWQEYLLSLVPKAQDYLDIYIYWVEV